MYINRSFLFILQIIHYYISNQERNKKKTSETRTKIRIKTEINNEKTSYFILIFNNNNNFVGKKYYKVIKTNKKNINFVNFFL